MFTADPLLGCLSLLALSSGPWLLEDCSQDTSERVGLLWEARGLPKTFWWRLGLRCYPI